MMETADQPTEASPVSFPETQIWRSSGGDHARRGLFPKTVQLEQTPTKRWEMAGAVQAPPVFDAHTHAYVADMSGMVRAFDPQGRQRWQVQLKGGISAAPAVHPKEDRLYVGTFAGWVYALDSSSGRELWRKEIPTASDARILSDLLLLPAQNVVILNSWGGRFYALDAASGAERFSWDAGITPYAGAAADSREIVYCLRTAKGAGLQWLRVEAGGKETVLGEDPEKKREARRMMVCAAPVVDAERGVVYFVANRDRGSAIHAWSVKQATLLWTRTFPRGICATPALRKDGILIVADLEGNVSALGADGAPVYRYVSGCEYLLASPVCDAADNVFVGDPTGVIHQIDRAGLGQPLHELPRAVQARAAFDPHGNLCVPCTDRAIYRWRNTAG